MSFFESEQSAGSSRNAFCGSKLTRDCNDQGRGDLFAAFLRPALLNVAVPRRKGPRLQSELVGVLVMITQVLVRLCALATFFSPSIAFAAGPFGTIHVETWRGGAFTNDNTAAFDYCAVKSDFTNGITLIAGKPAIVVGFWHFPALRGI